MNYRKGQACLSYYHEILKQNPKITPWTDIHDQYETMYFYPNLPYFQQKGKNKNNYFTNGRHFYKRYVLTKREERLCQSVIANAQENGE